MPTFRPVFLAAATTCATVVLAGSLTVPASGVLPGTNGKLAFARNAPGGASQIYVADSIGANPVNVSSDSGFTDSDPEFSPDGTKIAFVRRMVGINCVECLMNTDIWVMDANGANKHNVSNVALSLEDSPTWSPNGSKIAYVLQGDVWVMDAADGANKTNLTNDAATDGSPAWSPDGTTIAYMHDTSGSFTPGKQDIWLTDADGNNKRKLTNPDDLLDSSPAWSPDGSKIAYMHATGGNDIWIVNTDGSNPHSVVATASGELFPAWSPDGTSLAYTYLGATNTDILRVNPANGDPLPALAATSENEGSPSWASISATCDGKAVTIPGTDGPDTLKGTSGPDVIAGLAGKDTISGAGGDDTICGGRGADVLKGGKGADRIIGDAGVDTATYAGSSDSIVANLSGGLGDDGGVSDGPAGSRDTIGADVENLTGGNGADRLSGNTSSNRIEGGPGADKLFGLGGTDYLVANDGVRDTRLDGGGGFDTGAFDAVDPPRISVP